MKKVLLSLFVYISVLLTVASPVFAATTGTISASAVPPGGTSTSITYSVNRPEKSEAALGQIFVDDLNDTFQPTLLGGGRSGTITANFLQPGHTYKFTLYRPNGRGTGFCTVSIDEGRCGYNAGAVRFYLQNGGIFGEHAGGGIVHMLSEWDYKWISNAAGLRPGDDNWLWSVTWPSDRPRIDCVSNCSNFASVPVVTPRAPNASDRPLNEYADGAILASVDVAAALPGVSCTISANPATSTLVSGQNTSITWSGTATGGNGTFTYVWSGTDGLTSTQSSVVGGYPTAGTKTANLVVTSGGVTGTCTGTTTINPAPTIVPTIVPTVVPTIVPTAPPTNTVSYKISETVEGLNLAPELPYTVDASGNLITSHTFQNPKIGANFVFVLFKDTTGKWGGCGTNQTQACTATIELISVPSIGSCNVDTSKSDRVTFEILPKAGVGNGYGAETGKVELGDVNLQTLKLERWDDGRIIAVLSGQPTDQGFQVKITDKKGLSIEGYCSSLSQLSLGTKLFCRAPQSSAVNDVSFILAEGKDKGLITRATVSIDKKGLVQGLTNTKLVEGQGYKIGVKAPKSVRKNIEFTAGKGTTILSNIRLAVGDIFPLDGGDGKINSADAAELMREWRVVGSGADKPGDFNDDGLVNSFDWACLRFDFGASDDPEPVAGPISKPVQSTSTGAGAAAAPSVAPSATAVPSASVSSI